MKIKTCKPLAFPSICLLTSMVNLTLFAEAAEQSLCRAVENSVPTHPGPERPPTDGVILLSADKALHEEETNVSTFEGEVLLQRDAQFLAADSITYEHEIDKARAKGNVTFWGEEYTTQSAEIILEGEGQRGTALDNQYWLKSRGGRGKAKQIDRQGDNVADLQELDYTTCAPGEEVWVLESEKTRLDFETETGTARNVVIRFQNIPVFYTPYLSFPISDKRKSGFLFPRLGNSTSTGTELSIPYYWNIAPNYDATLTPRFMSKRGFMLESQTRYLTRKSLGKIEWEFLPNDNELDEQRYLLKVDHLSQFSPHFSANLIYNEASDRRYFEDLGTSLDVVSTTHLERRADLMYRGPWYNLLARIHNFQTLDPNPLARPYERLPQLVATLGIPEQNRRFSYQLHTEFVHFERDVPNLVLPVGNRVDLKPSISYLWRTPGIFVKPKLSYRYTTYDLNDQPATVSDAPDRSLFRFSTDAGMVFERPLQWRNMDWVQTLEPRLFYQYSEFADQTDIPVFDTSEFDFSFGQLFREDRFSGPDRVDDDHRVSMAVTSRFLQRNNGREMLRASVGQSYYLRDRRVSLPGIPVENDPSSNLIGEIAAQTARDWRISYTLQWDPDDQITEQSAFGIRYSPDTEHVINVSYRSRNDAFSKLEQTDVSWHWPLAEKWRTLGRFNYSIQDRRLLETFAGIEYNDCCWAFRIVGRRYLQNLEGEYQTGVFIQLELKGLAGLGRSTAEFLSEQIPGFRDYF